jgi:hypothetical protein
MHQEYWYSTVEVDERAAIVVSYEVLLYLVLSMWHASTNLLSGCLEEENHSTYNAFRHLASNVLIRRTP